MRVVSAFDGSASSWSALTSAIDEADVRSVPLLLVTAIDIADALPVATSRPRESARLAAQKAVRLAAGRLGAQSVDAPVEIGPASVVVPQACRPDDLLVCGTHNHGPVARVVLGSTSSMLSMHAPCPVTVVKAGPPPDPDAYVLVGVDGSAASKGVTWLAAELAAAHGVPLLAVLALPPHADAFGLVVGPDEHELEGARAALAESVAGLPDAYPDLVVRAEMVQSHPVEALLSAAQHARTAVVGRRGLGAVASLLLGSVSRELLHRAPCPVLIASSSGTAHDESDAIASQPRRRDHPRPPRPEATP